MIDRDIVVDEAEKAMEGTDLFLVDVVVNQDNEIEIEVDSMQRMSIDQCCDLNRKIETALDRDKEDFSLSVYSAGIGYPFKVFRQYEKAEGKIVSVAYPNGAKLEGEMHSPMQTEKGISFILSHNIKVRYEGEKRPKMIHREDRIDILPGVEVKEIITIK